MASSTQDSPEYWRTRALNAERALDVLKGKTVILAEKVVEQKGMMAYLHQQLLDTRAHLDKTRSALKTLLEQRRAQSLEAGQSSASSATPSIPLTSQPQNYSRPLAVAQDSVQKSNTQLSQEPSRNSAQPPSSQSTPALNNPKISRPPPPSQPPSSSLNSSVSSLSAPQIPMLPSPLVPSETPSQLSSSTSATMHPRPAPRLIGAVQHQQQGRLASKSIGATSDRPVLSTGAPPARPPPFAFDKSSSTSYKTLPPPRVQPRSTSSNDLSGNDAPKADIIKSASVQDIPLTAPPRTPIPFDQHFQQQQIQSEHTSERLHHPRRSRSIDLSSTATAAPRGTAHPDTSNALSALDVSRMVVGRQASGSATSGSNPNHFASSSPTLNAPYSNSSASNSPSSPTKPLPTAPVNKNLMMVNPRQHRSNTLGMGEKPPLFTVTSNMRQSPPARTSPQREAAVEMPALPMRPTTAALESSGTQPQTRRLSFKSLKIQQEVQLGNPRPILRRTTTSAVLPRRVHAESEVIGVRKRRAQSAGAAHEYGESNATSVLGDKAELVRRNSFSSKDKNTRHVMDPSMILTIKLQREQKSRRLTQALFKIDPALFPTSGQSSVDMPLFVPGPINGIAIENESDDLASMDYALNIIPDVYKERFFQARHLNFIGTDSKGDNVIISVMRDATDNLHPAVINGRKGFKEFEIQASLVAGSLTKLEKQIQTQLQLSMVYLVANEQLRHDLLLVERMHSQIKDIMLVGLIYCKHGQSNPLDMFKNQTSGSFDRFISILGFNKAMPKAEVLWRHVSVHLHPSCYMDAEGHRRLIGNDRSVIFFKDEGEPFDASGVDNLGTMPQNFIIVQPRGDKYRVGFFRRVTLREFGPKLPANHLFDSREIQDFLFTKVYNGMIMTMFCPPMSRLFEIPRQAALDDLVKKYPKTETVKGKFVKEARKRTDSVGAAAKRLLTFKK